MPRGTGKTTITSIAAGWALAYGYRRFIAILSANHRESKKMMKLVLSQFITPSEFTADFPEICYPLLRLNGSAHLSRGQIFNGVETRITFASDTLVFPTIPGSVASGSAVLCAGVGSAIRGLSVELPSGETIRPDMVLLDDIQTGDVARNPDRVEKLEQEIASTIDGLAESGHEMAQVMTITVNESGDLADRFLDPAIYPWWNGIRGKMLDRFPDRMDLWREFRSRYFQGAEEAHRFYLANRREMAKGAEVSWPDDYDPKHYADALEYAMTKWSQNERAFYSERQNSPQTPPGSAIVVPAKTIMSRVNGLDRRVCPYEAYKLTGFIDVHDDLLYWVVVAWTADFTGFVIDYGTFPEQSREYFSKGDGGLETMPRLFNSSPNASLKMGIELLLGDMASWEYDDENGKSKHGIDRVFIDSKYKPEIVEAALRMVKSRIAVPAKGVSVKATNRPMAEWPRKNSRKFLFHLIDEKIEGRAYRSVLVDSN
ncbi:MAG: phage terminase large subunit family protein, partial [Clostridia bacterium]|nr:phage terminase large subunit family protein [Clostridia bacterium]